MEKEFIPYELALRMKQLGFDEKCFRYYQNGFLMNDNPYLVPKNSHLLTSEKECSSPLFQQAFRWFREKGYLISFSSHDTSVHDFYIKWQPSKSILSDTYDTYEEAELACLEKLIDIVEQKQKDI
jgi:hypothetical protein